MRAVKVRNLVCQPSQLAELCPCIPWLPASNAVRIVLPARTHVCLLFASVQSALGEIATRRAPVAGAAADSFADAASAADRCAAGGSPSASFASAFGSASSSAAASAVATTAAPASRHSAPGLAEVRFMLPLPAAVYAASLSSSSAAAAAPAAEAKGGGKTAAGARSPQFIRSAVVCVRVLSVCLCLSFLKARRRCSSCRFCQWRALRSRTCSSSPREEQLPSCSTQASTKLQSGVLVHRAHAATRTHHAPLRVLVADRRQQPHPLFIRLRRRCRSRHGERN